MTGGDVGSRRAVAAWVGLGVYVVAADLHLIRTGRPTMSTVWRNAAHPSVRGWRAWTVRTVWAVLTLHLFTRWRIDPISAFGRVLSRRT